MQENSLKKVGLRVPAFFGKVMITLQHLQIRIDWPQTFQMQGTSALSHLQIRIDWPQRLQMQEAAAKIGSADPLSCCAAADGAFAANPAGRGPGGRELWRPQPPGIPSILICRCDRALRCRSTGVKHLPTRGQERQTKASRIKTNSQYPRRKLCQAQIHCNLVAIYDNFVAF